MASRVAGVRAPMGALSPRVAKAFAPLASASMRLAGQEPLFTQASIDALENIPRELDPEAARVLGHAPRPLLDTLLDTYAFFEERGLAKLGAKKLRRQ